MAPTRDYLNIIIGFGFIMTLQVAIPAFLRAEGKVKEASIGAASSILMSIASILMQNGYADDRPWLHKSVIEQIQAEFANKVSFGNGLDVGCDAGNIESYISGTKTDSYF